MLKVKTLVRDSSINGKGLIADEDIPKGTITWEFFSGIDIVLDGLDLSDVDRKFVKKYSFKDKQTGKWILSYDNDRYTNHSDDPNTGPTPDGKMIALRDIKQGEEITSNYYDIDINAKDKLK